ncbi:unnamed protein product [Mucor hiemalis]
MLPSTLLHFNHKHTKDAGIGYLEHIDTIEDTLRAFSLLLPGRFEDADLCSQAILAGLNLVSLFHTKFLVQKSLLNNNSLSSSEEKYSIPLAFNERFLQYNASKKSCEMASWTLSVISYTEVIVEMILNRKVSKLSRWKWVASMEGVKVILRLILFYGTKKKMILHPTHFIRNIDPVSLDVCEEEKFELLNLDPRTGTALSANTTYDDNEDTPSPSCVAEGKSRTGWGKIGELLWIIRPFIYASMILLEQRRKKNSTVNEIMLKHEKDDSGSEAYEEDEIEKDDEGSWKPWLVSLSIDLIARIARNMQPMSRLERDESKRRDYLFIYYLFRGPIYLKFTR